MGSKERCRHTGVPLFTVRRKSGTLVRVGGASDAGIYSEESTSLLVDLRAYEYKYTPAPQSLHLTVPRRLHAVIACFPASKEVLEIPWPDMGVPPFGREFFEAIVEATPGSHLVFACAGGHGRTGTALAAMRIVHLDESAQAAIEWVRRNHCHRAVESDEQIYWLGDLARFGEGALWRKEHEMSKKEKKR